MGVVGGFSRGFKVFDLSELVEMRGTIHYLL